MNVPSHPMKDIFEVELPELADLLGRSDPMGVNLPYRPRLSSADPSFVLGLLVAAPISLGLWIAFVLILQALLR